MMQDAALGQYYPADSPLHRLDPRTKLKGVFLYVIGLFFVSNLYGYGIAFAFLAALVLLSKVPISFVARSLKPVLIIILLTVAINLVWTQGNVVWQFWIIKVSDRGISLALNMGSRLVLLICGSSLLTLTTTTVALTDGIEALMKKIPVARSFAHEVGMMMSIALSFIPTLMEEMDRIMKAQKSRGADFESGNLLSRARALIPILVPLFVSAIQRANELAMAMESRCYMGGENRTRMKELAYRPADHWAMAVLASVLALAYAARWIP
jgi:energy-coupling factor transport system permease protein